MTATATGTPPALVVIEKDAVLVAAKASAAALLEQAKTFTITPNNRREASAFLVEVATLKRRIEERRKTIVGPHTTYTSKVNAFVKAVGGPVVEADELMRDKLRDFLREEEALQARLDAEARRAALSAGALVDAAQQAQDEGRKDVAEQLLEEAVSAETTATAAGQLAAAAPPLERTVKTDVGTVTAPKVWTFEVTNIEKIPREYLRVEINTKAVKDAIAVGVRPAEDGAQPIPGIRIFEDYQMAVRPS